HGHDPDGTHRAKYGMAFFGAESRPPGMDAFDEALALARRRGETAVQLRGRECELAGPLADAHQLQGVCGDMVEVWAKARRNAWVKANETDLWEGLRYLVVGGGSKVPAIVQHFKEPPGYLKGKLRDYGPVAELGRPADLRVFPASVRNAAMPPAYRGDHTFLLVAYGLSFHTGELPHISLPGDVPPFRRVVSRREFVDALELGYEER
ncbi:MAG: hypothetical protein FJ102_25600, partial [Deltaproteobacteria bacterium]|nr:hypothetical protein [Deltaproteobacteria bacterium]